MPVCVRERETRDRDRYRENKRERKRETISLRAWDMGEVGKRVPGRCWNRTGKRESNVSILIKLLKTKINLKYENI